MSQLLEPETTQQLAVLDEEATGTLTAPRDYLEVVPEVDYYEDYTAVSNSMVKDFLENRPEYFQVYVERSLPRKPPTEAMILSNALHVAVLEPHSFLYRYAFSPKFNRSTTIGKKGDKDFREANLGKIILDLDDQEQLRRMGEALFANPVAKHWLSVPGAHTEKVCRWKCRHTGLERKAKLDWVSPDDRLVIDLKGMADCRPWRWSKDQTERGYHRQVATYLEAAEETYGGDDWAFLFLVVSKGRVPLVGPYILPDTAVELGRRENLQALEDLRTCQETGDWSEPWSKAVTIVDVAKWAYFLEAKGN